MTIDHAAAHQAAATPDHAEPTDQYETVRVLTIVLEDEQGNEHAVRIDENDWTAACGLTPVWHVEHPYGKPGVVSTDHRAVGHRQHSWRDFSLSLARFIMEPPRGQTVRFLDGSPLNLARSNLVCRPKWAPTVPKPATSRPPTARERRLDAIVQKSCGRYDEPVDLASQGHSPSNVTAPATTTASPAAPTLRKRRRRPGRAHKAPQASTTAAGGLSR